MSNGLEPLRQQLRAKTMSELQEIHDRDVKGGNYRQASADVMAEKLAEKEKLQSEQAEAKRQEDKADVERRHQQTLGAMAKARRSAWTAAAIAIVSAMAAATSAVVAVRSYMRATVATVQPAQQPAIIQTPTPKPKP